MKAIGTITAAERQELSGGINIDNIGNPGRREFLTEAESGKNTSRARFQRLVRPDFFFSQDKPWLMHLMRTGIRPELSIRLGHKLCFLDSVGA